jgi:hypothetical protein
VTFKQKPTEAPHAGAYIQLRAYEVAETDGEPGGKTQALALFPAEVPAIPSDGSEVTVTFTDFKVPKIAPDKSLYLKVWYVSKPFKLDNLYSAIGSAKFRCDFKGDAAKTSRCLFVPN